MLFRDTVTIRNIVAIAASGIENTFGAPLDYYTNPEPVEKKDDIEVVIVSKRTVDEVQSELAQVVNALTNMWRKRREEIQEAYNRSVVSAPQFGGVIYSGHVGPNPSLTKMREVLEMRQKELEHELHFAISYERNPKAYHRS